jgi:hypothetical protein
MMEQSVLMATLGAAGQHALGRWWPLVLGVFVLSLVIPLAYMVGRGGGRAGSH